MSRNEDMIYISVCTHTRQVEHQRCSRTGRVQKNYNILRKNTIFYEHPVAKKFGYFTITQPDWLLRFFLHASQMSFQYFELAYAFDGQTFFYQ